MKKQSILHARGLKTTPARIAVLDILEKQKNPKDVFSIVESLNHQADQATVYRILNTFYEKGIVSRIEIGEGKYRYELDKLHHHHLICLKCKKIEDVEGEYLKDIEDKIRIKKEFLIKSHSLEFFGICKNCQY